LTGTHETVAKLNEMRFFGMSRALETAIETGNKIKYTAEELVGLLVESEWEERQIRKQSRLIQNAKFRYNSSFEELSFDARRNLDKDVCMRLSTCQFIKKSENVLITGLTGAGKSFLASAIGNQACHKGLRVKYFSMMKLFDQLRIYQADGSYIREMGKIAKSQLLILDDFGVKPFTAQERLMMMEIMEDRHGRASTVITSQHPISNWYEIIGEPTLADAILDRLVHSSHIIKMDGINMREKRKKNVASKEEKK